MKSLKLLLISLAVTFSSCSKEHSNKWIVIGSGIVATGDHLILISDLDFSDSNPYILSSGTSNLVWEEDHQLGPTIFGYYLDKQIVLEIPDSLGIIEFLYEDQAIYENLNCAIYYFDSGSKDDGYYRIKNGFIEGKKIGNEWIIDFEVFFGGVDNDKYKMIKDANY